MLWKFASTERKAANSIEIEDIMLYRAGTLFRQHVKITKAVSSSTARGRDALTLFRCQQGAMHLIEAVRCMEATYFGMDCRPFDALSEALPQEHVESTMDPSTNNMMLYSFHQPRRRIKMRCSSS